MFFFRKVLYCSLLAQAQTEADKHRIVEQMESSPELLKILRALMETDKEDVIQEERARRQAARKSRVDADIETGVDDTGVKNSDIF